MFTREQLHDILCQPDLGTITGYRDYVMLLLLIETGLRVKELVNIRIEDINFEDNMIRIRDTKGLKERLVPFQATFRKYLKTYLKYRGQLDHSFLFVNIDNEPISIRLVQQGGFT